ncbi:tetraacyldisaccharide 4'-kinase [Bradyrhizobium sp. U87765 SZCCT0131]|uniref:tetraacyldisaccharide 4'-kinase n=1 Tax=unclassified Bradyrhizobium TaxID=2631580 RepID=UPI001BAD7793|nr:tetraacyldisaccharide 4'-kinase [Bradyrhizobium sp. U87765 SZCCT0131]MBR1265531.1 tetraacyldisaccharide 4'-kinase [Bradyrhizobium sp. U87765 SZCCT0134]MBR1304209.1 tetraacyldisaccharide 4'-kinase [Bradyrhizobium sp. U87765 SZCCT0110]MBR1319814.1 tetraacyldisaccharide 4'-kinase [Bradyrhizobium sp. U87765 SZCCT0109]MBR1348140.1 tetraacyldisaccharide 4'-kinase [Bradyrhizobium sp. U87765 SZCCT0048]
MREPAFWHRGSSWQSLLLSPLGAVYGSLTARRMARPGARAGIPVVCVGNYHLGGAGKTPTVLMLAGLLRAMGAKPWVVSRGYGGRLTGPVVVDPRVHGAADVGDEPLMMADRLPVVVARRRDDGAALARAQGANVILLDDGFQNPALIKDVALIVIDSHRGLGNGCVFPAGPLRAPLPPQLARTDALVVVGDGTAAQAVEDLVAARGKPVLRARLVPNASSLAEIAGRRVLAFAGIGDPGRFFSTLRGSGVDVAATQAFADHHPFTVAEIDALVARAAGENLVLVTTEKDLARIRSDARLAVQAPAMVPFGVSLSIAERAPLDALLTGLVAGG